MKIQYVGAMPVIWKTTAQIVIARASRKRTEVPMSSSAVLKKIPWMIKSMICHLGIAEWLIKTNWSITHKKGESTARSKMHHTFYSFIWPNNFTFYENHLFIYLVKSGNIFLHLCFRLFTWKTLLKMGSFYFYII